MEKRPYQELMQALIRRREVIADRDFYHRDAEGHLAALKSVSEQTVELAAKLPEPIDPQLRHYLARCSYDKALDWLQGYLSTI
jgi:hypothetical protein